jgi:uncharacterized protein (DUF342 family)
MAALFGPDARYHLAILHTAGPIADNTGTSPYGPGRMPAGTNVRVIVSPDRLRAWVRVNPQLDPRCITPQHVQAAIEQSRIAVSDAVASRIGELCRKLQAGYMPEGDFLVAEQPEPAAPVDARFEWTEALRPWRESEGSRAGRVSHYDRNSIVCVRAGQVVGTIVPAKAGGTGVDVYGHSLPAPHKPRQIALRGNVQLAPDGRTVQATRDGRVVFEDNKLSVVWMLELQGSVDFGTGNIDSPGDVIVHGSVKDLFRVRSARNITVDLHVDGAMLAAGGDIALHGGVHGHGKAVIRAGGRIETKLCDSATIEAGKALSVTRECINCRVRADRISSPGATLIGGYAWARNGVEVQNLGSPAGVKTVVAVGIPTERIEEALEMTARATQCRDAARKIREAIVPLLGEASGLAAAPGGRATVLMRQAEQLERQAKDLDQKRENLLRQATPDGEPYVLVNGRIHPGVTIAISGRATVFHKEMRGPVRIVERQVDGRAVLAAVDALSSSVQALPTVRFTAAAQKQAMQAGDPAAGVPAGA